MMTQSTPFPVLVAALLISTIFYCSAENVYCVTPTATLCSSCPHNSTHCATLSEYAQEPELYLTSNTTMVFLSGDHCLHTNITVANVARLTMCGESSSSNSTTIVCNGSVGFSFTSMVDLKLYSLTFTSCSRGFGSPPISKCAMLLDSIENAELVNCSFHDNLGTALVVNNTNIILDENTFAHNYCACESFYYICELGCGTTGLSSNLTFTGNTTFLENNAAAGAAGIYMVNCSLTSIGSIQFINNVNTGYFSAMSQNTELPSGAIWALASSLQITGTNTFNNNTVKYGCGGAVYAGTNTSLRFIGTSKFNNNSATNGGAIYTYINNVLCFSGTNIFSNNTAEHSHGGGAGGAIYVGTNASLSFTGTSHFNNNSANRGGAIYTYTNNVLSFTESNIFIGNSAHDFGITGIGIGGAIFAYDSGSISFTGTSSFNYNSASSCGVINTNNNAVVSFSGTSNFSNNSALEGVGGMMCTIHTEVSFSGTSNLNGNFAMQGGAIYARYSTLIFNGTITFSNNENDFKGGAVSLENSTFSLLPDTIASWEKNRADVGGAIYVEDKYNSFIYCPHFHQAKHDCFFQLPGQNLSNDINVQLVFRNNVADTAGSVLYGGAIDKCKLVGLDSYSSGKVFDMIVHIEDDNTTSKISSDPFKVCYCENNHPDCNKSEIIPSVYAGETFPISVVAVGQRNGISPSPIKSSISDGNILPSQITQQATTTCTTLHYTVFAPPGFVYLSLYASGPCSIFGDKLVLNLNISHTCPPGFNLSQPAKSSCVCEPRLEKFTHKCNITNGLGRITRDSGQQFWVGYDHSHGLILNPHCPIEYCVSHTVTFSLNNTNVQCKDDRSGLLCGACKKGYSLVLGTSKCKQCTNNYLALLIPFAVMGVALVFLLLVCKLTVATGTLSGLVFYANIAGVNRNIFLPGESTNAFSVFIAWLNLDFGIETCFYNGMDAYSKTWLQFVFPVYIWVLVGLMVLVSHFSHRFAHLLGNNPVTVLATLILLSYTKVLRTLIAVVYITYLEYQPYNRAVWLYDANIDYLSGKHIPLFVVAVLVFLFLFLPYTLLLLFGQWLQAISHLRFLSWVNSARLKPFLDSYHAPYKAKHRYWPGMLLVFRFVLLLVFALNPQQDTSINMLAILIGIGVLQLWAWVSGGVYKNWCLDALEGSFVLNLIILVGATYHISHLRGNQLAVGYTAVSITLLTFLGILAYHILQQLRHFKLCKRFCKLNLQFKGPNIKQAGNDLNNPTANPIKDTDFDQLREPLLEDKPHYGAF